MRPWIECLFQNTAAQVDFIKYMTEIDIELTNQIQNTLTGKSNAEGKIDTELATRLAFELAIFRKIRDKFQRDTKEHIAQVSHKAKGR